MKSLLLLAALLPLAPAGQDSAPDIQAQSWVNYFGQAPSNDSLLGRAVLIESWATW